MARKVRFPLNMNGIQVRTLEELQENFHLESVLCYFQDGKLEQWIRDRYFDDKADAIAKLDKSDSELSKKLCEILEVEYSAEADVDMEEIERRNEKMKELRKYCDDKEVIANIANVALTQDDLNDLLDEDKDKIYLVHGKFEIPSKANVTYVGVAEPKIKVSDLFVLEEKGIKLVNIKADLVEKELDPLKDFAYCTKAAEQGNAEAQFQLGNIYSGELAVEWYTKAAEQGHAAAQIQLGRIYLNGEGVPKNIRKAVEWLIKAANQGDADAYFQFGLLYYFGEGVPRNMSKAVEWYTKAAEQGHANAQYSLALCYKSGMGVPKNISKAVEWYTNAARQGDGDSMYELGMCYYNGEGVDKNESKALEWFIKGARHGHQFATKVLLYYAEQGYATAQFELGNCYEKSDMSKAVEWYTKAAEQGYADAQYKFGWCYENCEGVPRNKRKALEWYRKAANQGNSYAKDRLKDLGEIW